MPATDRKDPPEDLPRARAVLDQCSPLTVIGVVAMLVVPKPTPLTGPPNQPIAVKRGRPPAG